MVDNDSLFEIATSLENDAVDSKTHIQQGKPPHHVCLTANRSGLLRLAASCLRAAAEPIVDKDCRSKLVEISQPHDQIIDDDSDVTICFLQRMETWPESNEYIEARKKRVLKNDPWLLLTCGVVSFIIILVAAAGITTLAGWFH